MDFLQGESYTVWISRKKFTVRCIGSNIGELFIDDLFTGRCQYMQTKYQIIRAYYQQVKKPMQRYQEQEWFSVISHHTINEQI
ncbi:hypothetical protein [Bacillus sp. CGMCC 1.16541]|uniref:hypothetical protein n=1 Tax=Bacillus sp. CGMCC 1.16541 TaxID=2185143 RepID=UPI000D7372D6|nr:hypothetical protein [Bacillus sp. CGMCC 1.16541]